MGILLIPFTVVTLAAVLFIGQSETPKRAQFRSTRWADIFRAIRNLAIPVTLTALSAVLLIAGFARLYEAVMSRSLTIAAGRPNTESYALIQAIQKVSSQPPARIALTFLAPGADSENLQRLQSGDASLAVAGSDIAPVSKARSVAVLYDNVGHLLARKDSAIARIPDLKGKRVGLSQSSDDYRVFLALAKFYGLGESDFIFLGGDQDSADATFLRGESDAVFRLQSAGSPYIKQLVAATDASLLPISEAGALKALSPGYEAATVPRAVYRSDPPVPASDITTVSTRRVLYARADLDAAVVADLAGVLLQRRAELAAALPKDAANLRHIATAARKPPVTSFDAAVHPGADASNRADVKSFVVRYGTTLLLVFAGALISIPAVLEWRRAERRRQKFELDRYHSRLVDLIEKSRTDRSRLNENLQTLGLQAIDDLKRDRLSPEGFAAFQYVWSAAMQKARQS